MVMEIQPIKEHYIDATDMSRVEYDMNLLWHETDRYQDKCLW